MSCMQRWNWRYNQLLVKPGSIPWALRVGSAFHDSMEQFYTTGGMRVNVATLQFKEYDVPSLQDHNDRKYWNAVLPMMIEAYKIYYKDDPIRYKIHSVEKKMDVIYRGLRLRGMIDLILEDADGMWIDDHKTTGRLNKDVVAGWDFRFQFMFYIWLLSLDPELSKLPIKGFYVNAVKKPELRVKQSESLEGFAQRVREDMIINPDKYFYRDKYLISKGALQHFQTEVVDPKIDILKYLIDHPEDPIAKSIVKNKNTDECQKWGGAPCPYLDLCRHGKDQMGFLYIKKPNKHEELEEEIE